MNNRDQMITELLKKTVHVVVDRPMGYLHGDLVYPVNYGYIPGLMAGDGVAQDAYILGVECPISSFDGQVISAIRRKKRHRGQTDCRAGGYGLPPRPNCRVCPFSRTVFRYLYHLPVPQILRRAPLSGSGWAKRVSDRI